MSDRKDHPPGTLTRSEDPGAIVPPPRDSAFDAASDRFEEVGELGRGGMGRVADVYDRVLSRRVAVKHVLSDSPASIARFDREARITAQLEHPGIVPLYETGRDDDGTPYYVMRRVDGRPLEELIDGADLDARLALVPNVLSACDAVGYAHARGIIHRDLKPSNILVGPFGETLVIDWGLARAIGDRDEISHGEPRDGLTTAGSIAGTPGFMAPEQARGEPLDARADVFALGATLFTTLSGTFLYDAHGETTVICASANTPAYWRALPPGIPRDLQAITLKSIAVDPAARYPNAGALAADLRQFVTGKLVAAHRYGLGERLQRFVRRHRAAVAIAAASIALLIAGAWVAVTNVVDARDDALAQARAAEVARQREAARADDLTLSRARQLLDTDPTLALATVRSLAAGPRWQDVAALVGAARARGVAWRLPVSTSTWAASCSPNGLLALTLGGDGVIRVHDLQARTTTIVAELHRTISWDSGVHVAFIDDGHVALFDAGTLAIIDVTSSTQRVIPLAAPAIAIDRFGGGVYWVDRDHAAWRLEPGASTPARIVVDDTVHDVWVSPDGAQLVITGDRSTWLVEGGSTPLAILGERIDAVGWDPDSADLYATTRQGSVVQLRITRPTVTANEIGKAFADVLVVRDRTLFLRSSGPVKPNIPGRSWSSWSAVAVGPDGVVVTATSDGKLQLHARGRSHLLLPTAPAIDLVAASPSSPYVVTIVGADLLVWDLAATMPHTVEASEEGSQRERVAGPHHLLVTPALQASYWLDLDDGSRRPGPAIANPRGPIVLSPSMTRGLDLAPDGTAYALRLGTTEYALVASDVKDATFVDERRIALARRSGAVELHDLDTKATTPLVTGAAPSWVNARGNFVVVTAPAGLTRVTLSTRATMSTKIDSSSGSELGADGRLWFADGKLLRCWELDGSLTTHTTLQAPIKMVLAVDDRHLAIETDLHGHIVDLVAATVRPTIRFGTTTLTIDGAQRVATSASGRGTGLLAVPSSDGVRILDGATGASWPVVGSEPRSTAALAKDASLVFERRDHAIVVWRVDVPRSPSATVARIQALTNATVGSDGNVHWPR